MGGGAIQKGELRGDPFRGCRLPFPKHSQSFLAGSTQLRKICRHALCVLQLRRAGREPRKHSAEFLPVLEFAGQ